MLKTYSLQIPKYWSGQICIREEWGFCKVANLFLFYAYCRYVASRKKYYFTRKRTASTAQTKIKSDKMSQNLYKLIIPFWNTSLNQGCTSFTYKGLQQFLWADLCAATIKITVSVTCINLNYLLIYCLPMEQSPSWEAISSSASQEIPHNYGTRSFITAFTSAHHLKKLFWDGWFSQWK
jgi:hypothetical protein